MGASPVEGNANAPGARPSGAALLRVDLAGGRVLRAYALPKGAQIFAAGDPGWSDGPVALLGAADGLHLSRLADAGALAEEPPLAEGRYGAAAFQPDEPAVAAASWDEQGGRLLLLTPGASQPRREIRLRSPGLVRPLGGGRWLLTLEDEEGRDTAATLDASGRVSPLLSSPEPIETAAAGPTRLFAVALSSRGPFDKRHAWLHPRELLSAGLSGADKPSSLPWSQHKGELLAVDEDAGRLYFAVTDRDAAAVWPLPLNAAALAAAVPSIDGPAPWLKAARLAVVWMGIMLFGAAIAILGRLYAFRGGGRR